MKSIDVSIVIDADPSTVWGVLADGTGYPTWDSGVTNVEGAIAQGNKIKVFTELSPKRAFPVKVTTFDPNHTMVWTGGLPLGLFKGERTFSLTPQDGGTHFEMREDFTGPLLGMMWKHMPDLVPVFDQFANGLKAAVEN